VSKHYLPAGSTTEAPFRTVVTPESAGWGYSGLRVLQLAPGQRHEIHTGAAETLVLPLSGGCEVRCGGRTIDLAGRDGVFTQVSDFAYLPRDASALISSESGGRFALPSARCERRLTCRYGPASDVSVELRGAGAASRQVNNFCTPETFDADKLIACEVLTPAGNWSSYPPHKHDENRPGECELEEIYYFEVARGGMGYQRVYGTADRPIDVLAEVRSGDVVLIPHGWHGPSMAAPGYDLYYLNVMAGPGADRAWLIQQLDPRLPLTGGRRP
jgi:5-deoxy-glucuronate isomerase